MLRYRTRKEAEALGVRGLGQDASTTSPYPRGIYCLLSVRGAGGWAEAKPGVTNSAASALPRRQVRGRLPDQRGSATVGGPLEQTNRASRHRRAPITLQPMGACVDLGESACQAARRVTLAGVPFAIFPGVANGSTPQAGPAAPTDRNARARLRQADGGRPASHAPKGASESALLVLSVYLRRGHRGQRREVARGPAHELRVRQASAKWPPGSVPTRVQELARHARTLRESALHQLPEVRCPRCPGLRALA